MERKRTKEQEGDNANAETTQRAATTTTVPNERRQACTIAPPSSLGKQHHSFPRFLCLSPVSRRSSNNTISHATRGHGPPRAPRAPHTREKGTARVRVRPPRALGDAHTAEHVRRGAKAGASAGADSTCHSVWRGRLQPDALPPAAVAGCGCAMQTVSVKVGPMGLACLCAFPSPLTRLRNAVSLNHRQKRLQWR